jgi:hypothetical protein
MYIIHIIIFEKDIAVLMYVPVCFATVVPDDDGQRSADEDHRHFRSQTLLCLNNLLYVL